MRLVVLPALKKYNLEHEGFTPFMYCDSLNLVTTGIGNLIDNSKRNSFDTSAFAMGPAMGLPWRFKAQGWTTKNPLAFGNASPDEIAAAWITTKLKAQEDPGFNTRSSGFAYAGLTQLTLDMQGIESLVSSKLASNERQLKLHYPNFDILTADAQFALSSMAWAMGSSFWPALRPLPAEPVSANNLPFFQAFKNAIDAEDYATAAIRSEFKGGGSVTDPKSRNHDHRIAFNNAAAVKKVGANPDLLFFPGAGPSSAEGIAGLSNPGIAAAKVAGGAVVAGLFGWALYDYWRNKS